VDDKEARRGHGQNRPETDIMCGGAGCGNRIPLDQRFCHKCGQPSPLVCKGAGCGKLLAPDVLFCQHCGQKTTKATIAKAEPVPELSRSITNDTNVSDVPDYCFCISVYA
jgi:hypothetical protein